MIDVTLLSLPFFQRALITGIILSVLMATLGVLIVLRRMSFFADAIGHAALTGIALGVVLQINPHLAALLFSLFVAGGLALARKKTNLPLDTLLGVFFSAAVAVGVLIVQLSPGFQTDLIAYLFGDILTISRVDVYLTVAVAIAALTVIAFAGKTFVTIAFDSSLARAEGIAVDRYELLLLLLLAAVIALAIKLVGIILVTAMLVIPAASAQNISRSLAGMFLVSMVIGLAAAITGMFGSAALNTASGPTIVLVNAGIFAVSLVIKSLRGTRPKQVKEVTAKNNVQ